MYHYADAESRPKSTFAVTRCLCRHCHKPSSACICDLIRDTKSDIEIVIWQHPKEANHPKNSALLLQLSLNKARTLIAERCDEESFGHWCGNDSKTNILLSPVTNANHYQADTAIPADKLRLIVIDGTWRKARKICHLNNWLTQLPTLQLGDDHQSLYRMRKAEKPGQYSTLEAVCLALSQIECNSDKYRPLLDSFAELNRRWDSFRR